MLISIGEPTAKMKQWAATKKDTPQKDLGL